MKDSIRLTSFVLAVTLCAFSAYAATDGPVAWWKFEDVTKVVETITVTEEEDGEVETWEEEIEELTTLESVSNVKDTVRGNYKVVKGTDGDGLKFDGFTTSVVREAEDAPRLGDAFTIEAWVAFGAYPWNWCPIVAQTVSEEVEHPETEEAKEIAGYYFGVDSQGRVGLRMSVDGKWVECKSEIDPATKLGLEMRRWYHVVGVYGQGKGLAVYIDGKQAASLAASGEADLVPDARLLIGRNDKPKEPTHPVRWWATHPSRYSWDGIFDEIKIYDRALSGGEIASAAKSRPSEKPDIPARKFPSVPRESARFGTYYTKLRYYDEWDALWGTAEHSDIVVAFDEHPINVMFWRGSRYSPCWVTENGKWMADQSRETGGNWDLGEGPAWAMPTGCLEHMSDAQCRFSRVRIIEDTDARVVVHWRYALLDVLYRQADPDPLTGWGLWGDEYYYIYPDGVGVRRVMPGEGGWQETIFFNEPGTRPEDNCELEAITLVNLKGESRTYSWERGYPEFDLDDPIIQMTNLKSQYRPFLIFPRGSEMEVFNVEVRPEYSHFPWWNHWPVAQAISDGRHCQAPDRASHSSLVWGGPSKDVALYGLTNGPAESLLPLATSWIDPPEIRVSGTAFANARYEDVQRAYVIECKRKGSPLEITLAANEDSPALNPAFVVKGWGKDDATLKIDGEQVARGKNFRFGHRWTTEGTDLIVWIKTESTKPTRISLAPVR